jgi:MSHA biogenesis protein MshM
MYLKHFGLSQFPFNLTPDTEFFCELPSHREALNVLLVALQNGEGFIKITGPVGSGKTLLCRKLLNELEESFITAYIPNPDLDSTALHRAIAKDLKIELDRNAGRNRVLSLINDYLLEASLHGKKVVLIIDEAQSMPLKTLETLRLLTNLETEKQKLLQIVLFGQSELDTVLQDPSIRQLRQRITFSYTLQPLTREQAGEYLRHRLAIAGNTHSDLLSDWVVRWLHRYSGGVPRLLNILCHKALLVAYGKGHSTLRWSHVQMAAFDTDATRDRVGQWSFAKAAFWLLPVFGLFGYLLMNRVI